MFALGMWMWAGAAALASGLQYGWVAGQVLVYDVAVVRGGSAVKQGLDVRLRCVVGPDERGEVPMTCAVVGAERYEFVERDGDTGRERGRRPAQVDVSTLELRWDRAGAMTGLDVRARAAAGVVDEETRVWMGEVAGALEQPLPHRRAARSVRWRSRVAPRGTLIPGGPADGTRISYQLAGREGLMVQITGEGSVSLGHGDVEVAPSGAVHFRSDARFDPERGLLVEHELRTTSVAVTGGEDAPGGHTLTAQLRTSVP